MTTPRHRPIKRYLFDGLFWRLSLSEMDLGIALLALSVMVLCVVASAAIVPLVISNVERFHLPHEGWGQVVYVGAGALTFALVAFILLRLSAGLRSLLGGIATFSRILFGRRASMVVLIASVLCLLSVGVSTVALIIR